MSADGQLSLTTRTVRGAGWIVCWRMVTRLLGTLSTLMLVRLLVPADFGLVALGTTFAQALDGLSEIGVGNALIREQYIDRNLYDTGFTLGLIRGAMSTVLIVCAAWPVAAFFGEPRLAAVLLALAAAMFVSSIENVGVVDFQRNLAFDKEFNLLLAPRILGIVSCVAVAYVTRSYWALVVGILVTRGSRMVCSYVMHPYRPRLSLRSWRRIVGFSFWSWMLAWVALLRDRVDNFTIGRMLGASQVGVYAISWDIGLLTSTELVLPICRALFPGLAQVRNRGNTDVADAYFRAVSATLLLTLPAGVGIALVADPLIRLAVGPRWIAAIPVVQLLAVFGIFRVVSYISTTLLTVFGILQVQFVTTAVTLAIRFVLLIILIRQFGLIGAGLAVAAVAILEEGVYLLFTFHRFKLHPLTLLSTNWRSAVATAAMAGLVLTLQHILNPPGTAPSFGYLLTLMLGGAATYTVVLWYAWLAAGRPWGAEAQIMAIVGEAVRSLRRRWLSAG